MNINREIFDKKQKIISKYNLSYSFYDKRYKVIQFQKFQAISKGFELSEKIILDAGCGTGLLFEYLLNHFQHRKEFFYAYIGVDISWNMLIKFKSKLEKINKSKKPKINLLLADLEYQPFREDSFNTIFSVTSLQNLPNIISGIKESFRVAKLMAEIKFSILKKKLDLNIISSFLKKKLKKLGVIKDEKIEDIIIQGNLFKK